MLGKEVRACYSILQYITEKGRGEWFPIDFNRVFPNLVLKLGEFSQKKCSWIVISTHIVYSIICGQCKLFLTMDGKFKIMFDCSCILKINF